MAKNTLDEDLWKSIASERLPVTRWEPVAPATEVCCEFHDNLKVPGGTAGKSQDGRQLRRGAQPKAGRRNTAGDQIELPDISFSFASVNAKHTAVHPS